MYLLINFKKVMKIGCKLCQQEEMMNQKKKKKKIMMKVLIKMGDKDEFTILYDIILIFNFY